jgi:hypothetical protein
MSGGKRTGRLAIPNTTIRPSFLKDISFVAPPRLFGLLYHLSRLKSIQMEREVEVMPIIN